MAEFANDSFSRARLQILDEEREIVQNAELEVPENFERGKNKYWDMILDTYTVENLKEKREQRNISVEESKKLQAQRIEGAKEAEELKELFNLKSFYYNLPFVETEENKSTIRKAPNKLCLDYVVYKMIDEYADKYSVDTEALFDIIEDAIFENLDNDE